MVADATPHPQEAIPRDGVDVPQVSAHVDPAKSATELASMRKS
jgi:hypothetical protein